MIAAKGSATRADATQPLADHRQINRPADCSQADYRSKHLTNKVTRPYRADLPIGNFKLMLLRVNVGLRDLRLKLVTVNQLRFRHCDDAVGRAWQRSIVSV